MTSFMVQDGTRCRMTSFILILTFWLQGILWAVGWHVASFPLFSFSNLRLRTPSFLVISFLVFLTLFPKESFKVKSRSPTYLLGIFILKASLFQKFVKQCSPPKENKISGCSMSVISLFLSLNTLGSSWQNIGKWCRVVTDLGAQHSAWIGVVPGPGRPDTSITWFTVF